MGVHFLYRDNQKPKINEILLIIGNVKDVKGSKGYKGM